MKLVKNRCEICFKHSIRNYKIVQNKGRVLLSLVVHFGHCLCSAKDHLCLKLYFSADTACSYKSSSDLPNDQISYHLVATLRDWHCSNSKWHSSRFFVISLIWKYMYTSTCAIKKILSSFFSFLCALVRGGNVLGRKIQCETWETTDIWDELWWRGTQWMT